MRIIFSKRFLFVVFIVVAVIVGFVFLRPKAEPIPVVEPIPALTRAVIGTSVQGRQIESYTYGSGTTHLAFVGGVHGGYEWNSVVLAYTFMDYVEAHPELLPVGVMVTVIPNANPDGVFKVVGKEGRFAATDVPAGDASAGRFNANKVDLNRNFACKWQSEGTWRGAKVSAGTAAFSEPEARAIRDFVLKGKPDAVVFWHSQANAVYASECTAGILPETLTIMNAYAKAAGYNPVASFDAYPVTGDAEGWLASIGVPAITVELSTHESVEWEKNLAGIKALLNLSVSAQ
jgi:predicted deacylase